MPVHVLSDAERERLAQFPPAITPDDLHAYFTLGNADHTFVHTHRGAANRLGVALQLGTLRYLGYWPDDVTQVPPTVVAYVAQQIDVPPASLTAYGQRAHTRTDHQYHIARYLGFRSSDMFDVATLTAWLVERALEHDRPRLLFHLALDKLLQERLVRPGLSVVERLVATARDRAQAETFQRLDPLLTPVVQTRLDLLLVPDTQTGRTPLAWLRQGATANTARAILEQLDKLRYVRQWDIESWPLDRLTPNRLKFLAQLGQKATNQALQRMAPNRRYPILVAFLWQMRELLTDEIVELFDRCLAHAHSRAARDLDVFRRTSARATNEKVRLFHDLARIVLDPTVADAAVRTAIYAEVPPLHLMAAVEEAVKLLRPLDDNYFDFVAQRYSYLRTFTPALLAAFEFRSHQRIIRCLGPSRCSGS